ncbi:MAG: radical SAM protein [Thaumarchaeota archaeon]|nr:radical SAM protein [Nitrososphaerota archaeon]
MKDIENIELLRPISLFKIIREEYTLLYNKLVRASVLLLNGRVLQLNETASDVLNLCNGEHSIREICEVLTNKYGETYNRILKGTLSFLKQSYEAGFITFDKSYKKVCKYRKLNMNLTEILQEPLKNYFYSPEKVYFEVTSRCNLKCPHCYFYPYSGKGDLSLDEIKKLSDELERLGVFSVAIGGGEPLLREDITEVVKQFCSKNLSVTLATNGAMLTESLAEELWKVGLRSIQFSLDGNEEVHDNIRGRGVFKKVQEAIKLAKIVGFNVGIKMTIQKNNAENIRDVYLISKELCCESFSFNRAIPAGRAKALFDVTYVPSSRYGVLLKQFDEFYGKDRDSYKPQVTHDDIIHLKETSCSEEDFGCPAGRTSISISSDGAVKPCSYFPSNFVCGNIREKPLQEIWLYSNLLLQLRKIRRIDLWEPCRSCNVACDGGCRGASTAYFGSLYAPDPLCAIVEDYIKKHGKA